MELENEKLENDILIAEYLGLYSKDSNITNFMKRGQALYMQCVNYNSDWNHLMRIIEKIATKNNWSIGYTLENICQAEPKENLTYIEHVYKCVVSLLKSGKIN